MQNRVLSGFLLLFSIVALGNVGSFHFSSVYLDDDKRSHFQGFYNEVLRFNSADQMGLLIHQEIMQKPESNDLQVYRNVAGRMSEVTPGVFESLKLAKKALNHQREVLGGQTITLIPEKYEIDGYLEIGTDGAYINTLQDSFPGGFTGRVFMLNDRNPSAFDIASYVKRDALFPNYQFIPSDNFSPISEADIPTESLDLVTMYVGLHHTPLERLDDFLESVNRILRVGGVFILRDHDLNDLNESYVHLAHMTFNLATGVAVNEEVNEYRNFQPLQYWINLLERHGFTVHAERLKQEGDPSDNTLLRFTKTTATDLIKLQQNVRENQLYLRAEDQSILTVPEWWIVWNSQDYAWFVQNNGSWHFPYFKSIGLYWWVYLKSLVNTQGVNAGYNFMNAFLGVIQGTEYAVKGAVDKTWVRKKQTNPYIASIQNEYAHYINHTPFYEFPYQQKYREFNWKNHENDPEAALFRAEYWLKSYMAPLLKAGSGSTYGEESGTIGMIVYDPAGGLVQSDDRIEVVYSSGDYHALKVPRYQPFTEIILNLVQNSIHIEEVAGNQWIVLAIETQGNEAQSICSELIGCKELFSFNSVIDSSIKRAIIKVELGTMGDLVRQVSQLDGFSIKHIFDY